MKKMFKRTISTAVFAALVLSSVTALPFGKKAKKTSKIEYTQFDDVEKKTDKSGKVYDLGGMSIAIVDWWSGKNAEDIPANSPAEEETRAFHKWLQQTYNFTMIQKQLGVSWDKHPEDVANFCMSKSKENYVIVIDPRSAITGVKAGLYYDLSKLDNIDWSDPKWASGTEKILTKGKSFYAMRPLAPEPRGGVFFNKRLLQEAGIDPDLPYDLQKQGKWTWKTFEDLVKKCTFDADNDGVIDHYGMANSSTEFVPLAVMSNGVHMIGRDKNGKLVNNVGTDQSLEALSWCAHMATSYEMPQPEGSNWDWMYAAFLNGQVAFLVDQQYHTNRNGDFFNMVDDYGFVCFPLGPKGDGKYKTLHNDNMYVLPAFYDDARAAKIAKAFDLWTDPTPGYDGPDAWKDGFYPCFRDARAVDETLELMRAEPNPRFDTMISGINYMGDVIWVVYPGYVTPQQAYEDTKNNWAALIKEATY